MAGYSKWSKVKHIQGSFEAKRGAASGKLVDKITDAACLGGGRSLVEAAPARENRPTADSPSISVPFFTIS